MQGVAIAYVSTWKSLALSSDQYILSTFGASGSWALDYNLFADKWLGTGVVDDAVSIWCRPGVQSRSAYC